MVLQNVTSNLIVVNVRNADETAYREVVDGSIYLQCNFGMNLVPINSQLTAYHESVKIFTGRTDDDAYCELFRMRLEG